ncbi:MULTISPECIES: hypothetical protein [Acinetobacter]|uniref:hypothetical protein n=1 Tax=Acinetobacter TaxID=469 RepID=UPI0008F53974|nr:MULTISPECIES: hypothetical protein [Acinetobacter]OIJ37328.1 hypothetical protein BK820_11360 [Acinetobacter sp. LCT-H3]
MIIDFDSSMLDPNIVIAVACLKLNAYKLFPSDPKVREAYFSKNLLKFLNEQNLSTNINQQELMKYVLETNIPSNWKAIHSGGYAAGSMLIHLLAMSAQGEKPVIEKAKYMFQEWNMKKDRDSLKQYKSKGSLKSLQNAWGEYKTVAHLWASDILGLEDEITILNVNEENPAVKNNNLTANQIFDQDSRLFVAHIKAMENDYEKLNLGIDFIRLPHFEVGFVVTGMSTKWTEENKHIFSKYTFISTKKSI